MVSRNESVFLVNCEIPRGLLQIVINTGAASIDRVINRIFAKSIDEVFCLTFDQIKRE